jgi:hypothetical protein
MDIESSFLSTSYFTGFTFSSLLLYKNWASQLLIFNRFAAFGLGEPFKNLSFPLTALQKLLSTSRKFL